MNKTITGFAGLVVLAVVAGLAMAVNWVDNVATTTELMSLVAFLGMLLGFTLVGYVTEKRIKKGGEFVVVDNVRQLNEDGNWYLYTVTFNKLGDVIAYHQAVSGYFGQEEAHLTGRTIASYSLEEARQLARCYK